VIPSSDRLTTALSDRYRVERELGRGGMATVYLAHDLRHERDVAIKVLHPDLGAALGAERFLSEIRTTARLQHPHILPLLDSGAADGLLYYVMPYVRGETLRARLERERQLPIADAVRIAREVAGALDHAHKQGVIHRDIKPENILLQDGAAVVADFGIALAVQQAGGQRMTQTGLSLGTPQYMSPEQAMGERTIDARSDIYALGAVTYEMLAGEPPFTGASTQAIVAKVLTERPVALRTLRDTVPAGVEQAVLGALAKLPADRPDTAAAFIAAIDAGASTTTSESTRAVPVGRRASRTGMMVAMAANVLLAVGLAWAWFRPVAEPPTTRQQITLWRQALPSMLTAGALYIATQAAIAPDGSSIVFTDSVETGRTLMRKKRESVSAEPLAGTEGGVTPFFSPDGRWIGFTTVDGKLRKVPVTGGAAITLAENVPVDFKHAGWLDDGFIVYTTTEDHAVVLVSPNGGQPRRLNLPERYQGQMSSVSSLPDDRGFVGGLCPGNCAFNSDVFAYDRRTDTTHIIVPGATAAWYSPTGHLLYTMRDGGLFATEFDLDKMVVKGDPIPIIDRVESGTVALSRQGHLLYSLTADANGGSELVWVDRAGKETPVDAGWRGRFEYPALSPDGKSLAVSVRDRTTDLWIRNADGTRRKVIAPGTANWRPDWNADGKSLVFLSLSPKQGEPNYSTVMEVRADAADPATPLFRHTFGVWEAEVTPDRQWLVFRADEEKGSSNIYAHPLGADTTTRPFAVGPTFDIQLSLSPDGRYLAYTSDVQGITQVFVATFPDGRVRRMVSRAGGTEPRFGTKGDEVFFESAGKLWSVKLSGGAEIVSSEPQPLFPLTGYRRARNRPQYDVAAGDQRFLMIKDPPPPAVPLVVYVEHWFPELLAKMKR
jgi:serine/threonine-protein kinase